MDRPVREIALRAQGARVSVVKLLHPRYVVAGHLDGRITVWDLEMESTVDLVGHAGAIFSLDANVVSRHYRKGSQKYNTVFVSITSFAVRLFF